MLVIRPSARAYPLGFSRVGPAARRRPGWTQPTSGVTSFSERNRRSAADAAERADYLSENTVARAKRGILRWLDKLPEGDAMPGAELRKKLKQEIRGEFGPAVAELIEECRIIEVCTKRRRSYRAVHPGTPRYTPPDQRKHAPSGTPQTAHNRSSGAVYRCTSPDDQTTDPSWENGEPEPTAPEPAPDAAEPPLPEFSKPDYGPNAIPATAASIDRAKKLAHQHREGKKP